MWAFGDSFDLYSAVGDLNYYWDTNGASSGLSPGRFPPGQSLQLFGVGAVQKTSGQNHKYHHFNFAYMNPTAGSIPISGFTLFDGTTGQVSIVFNLNGSFNVYSGDIHSGVSTLLGSFPGAVPYTAQWVAFEVEVVIGNPGSVTMRFNNSPTDSYVLTGINTAPSGNAYANMIRLYGSTWIYGVYWDDFLWRSDTTAPAWLGDVRCYIRLPASNVRAQFTPVGAALNYECVDEIHEDKLTTYVESNTVGQNDLYSVGVPPGPPIPTGSTVIMCTTRGFAQKTDFGSRSGSVQLKSGSTTVTTSGGSFVTAYLWIWFWRVDINDPATGTGWTLTGVDNAQIGPILNN